MEQKDLPTYAGVLYPKDTDHMGHVNIAAYAAMFDAANWGFFARLGLGREYFEASGCGMAAVAQSTTYHKELFAGDTVFVHTELLEVREKTIRFRHTVRLQASEELVATTELIGAHLDRSRHRAVPFPPETLQRMRARAAERSEA